MSDIQIPVRAERSWYYRWAQPPVKAIFKLIFRHETRGIENLPVQEGAVIATNHASVLDPPLVGVDLPRPVYYMAKQSLHDIPIFGSLIRAYHSFPVKRGGFDRRAMRRAVEILQKKNLLLMFPEGTRTRDGNVQDFKAGIGKIVLDAGVGVVPGYIDGTFKAWPAGKVLPRPGKTTVTFGSLINFDDLADEEPDRKTYRRVAERIRSAVIDLKSCE